MKAKTKRVTRVLVVDDHPIVRLGIRQMICAASDLEVCAEADSASAALELARVSKPDLAVVDLSLGQGMALEVIPKLRHAVPSLQVLVLSMHDEGLFAARVLRAGARGYIMKHEAIDGLIDAIRRVLSGQIYLSEKMSQLMLERLGERGAVPAGTLETLSDRELEVFDLIGRGKSTAAIAGQLAVSIKTIETYRSNIKSKLKLRDATELIRFATTWAQRF
jgi:DNA-binding NarL/FixJ family response regulator